MRGGIFRCREGGNLPLRSWPPARGVRHPALGHPVRRVRHSARGHPARGVRHPAVRCGGLVVPSECVLDQSLQDVGSRF